MVLQNRKSIANYLTGLEAAAIDSSNILDEHIKNNGKSWNETRYKFTFSSFCDAVRKNLDVNVRGLFEQYQKEFSVLVAQQESSVSPFNLD